MRWMIQNKFSQELYGLDLKLEFSQPEFHPITSSRYFSLPQQKTTRSNGMKFRLEFSCPRKKSQDTPLLPMGKGERNMYICYYTQLYKKGRIRTNNLSTQSFFFRSFLYHTFPTGPKEKMPNDIHHFICQAEEVQSFFSDNVSLSRSLGAPTKQG